MAAVAALGEPTRRLLYAYVARQPEPVSRDDAAAALRIARATAAFHLDKLVAENLLTVTFERRTDRAGPGAGRPAKVYRRSDRQLTVTVPERHYDLAAHLMARALETGTPLAACARSAGAELATPGGDVGALLERHGFEPGADGRDVVLWNCPFHQLARAHPDLVCGMTLGLLTGLLDGLGSDLTARPDPRPGRCCVRLAAR